MTLGFLLGFIMSKEGITVDPLKVEAMLQLSPPHNIRHLQCLQGMENFLWRFVVNFANLTKGFMCILKKDIPFFWDKRARESLDALKQALASAPMLSPTNYSRELFIYLAASMENIGMLFV